jgi:hypothetical protein
VEDRRFNGATAQFLAAGSFGLLHITLGEWHWYKAKTDYLNRVSDLRGNGRCLQELRPPSVTLPPDDPAVRSVNKETLGLGIAIHHFNRFYSVQGGPIVYQCASDPCDQMDWQRRWSRIVNKYNTGGKGYTLNVAKDPAASGGVNGIVRNAVSKYDPK